MRTHRPARSGASAGADPARPARNAKAARNPDSPLGRLFACTDFSPVRVLTLIPFTTKLEEETTKHLRAGVNDYTEKLGDQELTQST